MVKYVCSRCSYQTNRKSSYNDHINRKLCGNKNIPRAVRIEVWNKYNGNKIIAKCFVGCGENISINNFICRYDITIKNGGSNEIQNIRPICRMCSRSIRAMNISDFMKKYGFDE